MSYHSEYVFSHFRILSAGTVEDYNKQYNISDPVAIGPKIAFRIKACQTIAAVLFRAKDHITRFVNGLRNDLQKAVLY